MLVLADHVEVPEGMVEDDEDVGLFIEGDEDFGEALVVRVGGEVVEGGDPLGGAGAGQVVYAEVEGLLAGVWCGPLDADGNVAGGGDGAQQHGGVDVVMVAEGDERGEVELLNLAAFEVEGELGGERRSPVATFPVDGDAVEVPGAIFEASHEGANSLVLGCPGCHEV